MTERTHVYLGDTLLEQVAGEVTGDIVRRNGERFYRIGRYDRMPPFFMSIVSAYDHWMFISSNGGITCGRGSPSQALFPYETDDRIHDAHATAGPGTLMLVRHKEATYLWQPFATGAAVYRTECNLYKNLAGNRLVFEEINRDLGLSFEYEWSGGKRFGFIRHATVRNLIETPVQISLLDGLKNILPSGVDPGLQAGMSTLVNAYRQAEVDHKTGAGIYTLSSIPTDRAEPSEALKATCAWSIGLNEPRVLLSTDQFEAFRSGQMPAPESWRAGQRADYFIYATLDMAGGQADDWYLLADVAQGPSDLVGLLQQIEAGVPKHEVEQDIAEGTGRLEQRAASADAFQASSDSMACLRHYSNSLFNIMRGGVFHGGYRIKADDLLEFTASWNASAAPRLQKLVLSLGKPLTRETLVRTARHSGDADTERLALEYLPLTFSRRHGDPSRPWNAFDINVSNPDGSEKLAYAGNWRDIFQNWEALAYSYPGYLEHFITKFVNASTADGYNPYRITRDGIDWELLEPDDPWSFIGYWGDHQVAYLLRLIELERACHPGRLLDYLDREVFVYADVPYRIRPYAQLLANPRDTVEFDSGRQHEVLERVGQIGSDGRLCVLADGSLVRANLLEKLLVMVLVKLGNLVPGGGIWMNTQRPEWNDANNALVGFGLSMITLCYLRRFLELFATLLNDHGADTYHVSKEVADFLDGVLGAFRDPAFEAAATDDRKRKAFMDHMGAVSEAYRSSVYAGFSGHREQVPANRLTAFIANALELLDDSITANRRPEDGLYHSYNILRLDRDGHAVEHLQEMLEGQVAVLNSGLLDPVKSLEVLDGLRRSRMFRSDQHGYTLYPAMRPAGFLLKNIISLDLVEKCDWIQAELDSGTRDFIERDARGRARFNGRFRNAADVRTALEGERGIRGTTADAVCDVFESVFDHRRFTGRSGAMYKYEGIGCIYWHMVSKLLLVVGEITKKVSEPGLRRELLSHYDLIRKGLGVHKSPEDYGAFPTDPYSHTPAFAGVQQPGMTGQVKEDLISRFHELGIGIHGGRVQFEPRYLKREEFLEKGAPWRIPGHLSDQIIDLGPGTLGFTLCGVAVIYRLGSGRGIRLYRKDADPVEFDDSTLDRQWTTALFNRDGSIRRIEVEIDSETLR